MKPNGNPNYWRQTHEPLNLALQKLVRQTWVDIPPIKDLQLQYIPHNSGKHCLESMRLSRLANEGGAHAVAIGLLRDAVETLSLVAVSTCQNTNRVEILKKWNNGKKTAGEIRKYLESDVWPTVAVTGLWGETWQAFWSDFANSVQKYSHFTPERMQWHQHVEIMDGKLHFWINHPAGDCELYRGARITAFQLLVFWAFAEIACTFQASAPEDLPGLKSLASDARDWLANNEVFRSGGKWEVQLGPFIYPEDAQYW